MFCRSRFFFVHPIDKLVTFAGPTIGKFTRSHRLYFWWPMFLSSFFLCKTGVSLKSHTFFWLPCHLVTLDSIFHKTFSGNPINQYPKTSFTRLFDWKCIKNHAIFRIYRWLPGRGDVTLFIYTRGFFRSFVSYLLLMWTLISSSWLLHEKNLKSPFHGL